MKLHLPSGLTVEVEQPKEDFPRLIGEAEAREMDAHKDVKELKRMAKQLGSWPVELGGES